MKEVIWFTIIFSLFLFGISDLYGLVEVFVWYTIIFSALIIGTFVFAGFTSIRGPFTLVKNIFKTAKPIYIYWAIFVYSITPFASGSAAFAIAAIVGATLNEGGSNPCIVLGYDLGGKLSSMLGFSWLSFYSIPAGFILLIIFRFFLFIKTLKSKQKNENGA